MVCLSARPFISRHLGQRDSAQAAAGGQQRHRFEAIGLARAIVPRQQHEPRPRLDCRHGVRTEISKSQAGDGSHGAELALRPHAHTRIGIST